jgi:hypothetical protein
MFIPSTQTGGVDDNGNPLLQEGAGVLCIVSALHLDRFLPQGSVSSEGIKSNGDLAGWEGPFPDSLMALLLPTTVVVCQTGVPSGTDLGILKRFELACNAGPLDPPNPYSNIIQAVAGTVVAMRENTVFVFDFANDATVEFKLDPSANPLELD